MSPTAIKPTTIIRAQSLRHEMTNGEKQLWWELREFRKNYGLHVRKQVPIGPYVTDFAVHAKKLIIEIDGEHHFTHDGIKRDKKRDKWFASQGYNVLRINTGDLIENFDGCIETILFELGLS